MDLEAVGTESELTEVAPGLNLKPNYFVFDVDVFTSGESYARLRSLAERYGFLAELQRQLH